MEQKINAEVLNYFRFDRLLLVVVARYMARAFVWLRDFRYQSVKDFFTKEVSSSKNFNKHEKKIISEVSDPAKMDITVLYKLFFNCCGISRNPEWHIPVEEGQDPSLGQVLYQLKDIRNKNIHDDPEKKTKVTDDDLDSLVKKLNILLTFMLVLAGQKAGESQDTINTALSSMETDLTKERHALSGISVEQFVQWAKEELLQRKNNQECSHYVEPRLLLKTEGAFIGSVVRLSDLFNYNFPDGSRHQVIHLTGEAGAGKTSLCQAVFSSWLTKGQLAHITATYQLVLSIVCGKVKSSDLHRQLRTWILPKTTRRCEDSATLTRLLRETKVLWLVDGWDEATTEARGLLHDILHSKGESDTVLVTCRPEFSASLNDLIGGKVQKVSLLGLDDSQIQELVYGMYKDNVSQETMQLFFNLLQSFAYEEEELNNPLKLRLLTEMWFTMQPNIEKHSLPSLLQIYMHRTDWQQKNLVERCQVAVSLGFDIAGKVEDWLSRLYQVSFDFAKSSSSLILDKNSENRLLQECGIKPTFFLSTFLRNIHSTDTSSNKPHYAFTHDTQRCFYAARYVENCCKDAVNAEAKFAEVLEGDFQELNNHVDPYLGMFDLIVQFLLIIKILLSRITCGRIYREAGRENLCKVMFRLMQKFVHLAKWTHPPQERWVKESLIKCRLIPVMLTLMEMWSSGLLKVNISASFLINTMARLMDGDGDPAKWLEVVRRCGYRTDLAKEVSQKINTKLWVIQDREVRAAEVLLEHVTPTELKLMVSSDPGRLLHIRDLLSIVADRRITLDLHLLMHFHNLKSKDLSDAYLELVCGDKSRCTLRSFSGHLSNHGLDNLTAAHYLSSLNLRIINSSSVHVLVAATQKLAHLKVLELLYDNEHFVVPHSSLDGSIGVLVQNGIKSILTLNGIRNLAVNLQLPYLRDSSVKVAVDFISGLSKRYVNLTVGKIDIRGVKSLVSGLSNNAVTVGNLRLPFYVKEYRRLILFGFGKLPPEVPIKDFIELIQDFSKYPLGQLVQFNSQL